MRIETRMKVMEGKLAVGHPLLSLKQNQKNKFYKEISLRFCSAYKILHSILNLL